MSCVALFTLSSALCGLAPNLAMLIVFRIIQGAGGGGLQPSEQSILADTFLPAQRGMAFAVYGVAVVSAPALGPTLGGWITDNYSWRWIFYINLPVGILSLIMTYLVVKDPPYEKARGLRASGGIDAIGLGLIALGLGALQIMLDKGQEDDWLSSHFIFTMAVLATVGIVGAIIWEFNQKNPMVDLHLLKDRNFAISVALMFCLGVVLLGSTVLVPLFLQTAMGYNATMAGLALTPGALVIMLVLPLVGFMLSHVQAKWMIIFGLLLGVYGLYRMSTWDLNVSFERVVIDRIIQASGLAFLFVPINTAAYMYLAPSSNNNASGLINLARNVGGSVGISVMTTVLARQSQKHQVYLVAHATPYSHAYNQYLHGAAAAFAHRGSNSFLAARQALGAIYGLIQQQSSMLSIVDDFHLVALIFLCVIPVVCLLKRYDPRKVKGASGALSSQRKPPAWNAGGLRFRHGF